MTIALKHSEIISGRGHMEHVNKIVNNFIETQRKNRIIISDEHKRELNKVTKILVAKHKSSKPVVIHSCLGFGKSTLLLEYIKYMCDIDDEFSALVVKKTIKECKEFAIGLGLKKEYKQRLAFGKEKDVREIYNTNEEKFIALALRGFNYDDCRKNIINPKEGDLSKEKLVEKYGDRVQVYTQNICNDCNEFCTIKNAKNNIHKYRIVVATHMRLFLSNDNKDILNSLIQWEDAEGNKHKRQYVFVDEKLDTVDYDYFKLKVWNDLCPKILASPVISEEIKENINKVNSYLINLPYPNNSDLKNERKPYDTNFEFDKSIKSMIKVHKPVNLPLYFLKRLVELIKMLL